MSSESVASEESKHTWCKGWYFPVTFTTSCASTPPKNAAIGEMEHCANAAT